MPSLDFKGKQFIHSHHLSVPFRELVVDPKKSLPAKGKKPSLDDNLIIRGDNLEGLKALLPRYAGTVDCKGEHLKGNDDTAYKEKLFDLLTEHASTAIRAGELRLGVESEQMNFTMLLEDSWREKLENTVLGQKK